MASDTVGSGRYFRVLGDLGRIFRVLGYSGVARLKHSGTDVFTRLGTSLTTNQQFPNSRPYTGHPRGVRGVSRRALVGSWWDRYFICGRTLKGVTCIWSDRHVLRFDVLCQQIPAAGISPSKCALWSLR
jgi:hypothetical protein